MKPFPPVLSLLALSVLGSSASAQWSAPQVELLFGSTSWGPSVWAGTSLGLSGDTLAVGAPGLGHPSGTNDVGYVHVFELNSEGFWNQVQLVGASDPQAFDSFGWTLALDGNTLAVGSPYKDFGAVYVFERAGPGAPFVEVAQLDSGQASFSFFGGAVALDGDTLVVGAEGFFNFSGRVHVFERDQGGPGAWGEVKTLQPQPTSSGGKFGTGVAVDGDTLAVSQPWRDRAHVFERDLGGANQWGFAADVMASDAHPNGSFGWGLALEGDRLVASASLTGPGNAGQAYVYERDHGGPGAWGEVTSFQGSGLASFAGFGRTLELDGDLLLAGTPDLTGSGTGVAHLFHRDQGGPGTWGELARLDPTGGAAGDEFGTSIALANGSAWVGAPYDDQGGPDAGVVRGYEVSHAPEAYCTAGVSAAGCAASIGTTGTASASAPSGFQLTASSVEGRRNGIFFFGPNGRQANPWGNGTSFQCVVPPVQRTLPLIGVGTAGLCDGAFAYDLNAQWCPSCPSPQHNPGPGALVQAQLWYRDPLSTSNQTTSLSDAVELLVAP